MVLQQHHGQTYVFKLRNLPMTAPITVWEPGLNIHQLGGQPDDFWIETHMLTIYHAKLYVCKTQATTPSKQIKEMGDSSPCSCFLGIRSMKCVHQPCCSVPGTQTETYHAYKLYISYSVQHCFRITISSYCIHLVFSSPLKEASLVKMSFVPQAEEVKIKISNSGFCFKCPVDLISNLENKISQRAK